MLTAQVAPEHEEETAASSSAQEVTVHGVSGMPAWHVYQAGLEQKGYFKVGGGLQWHSHASNLPKARFCCVRYMLSLLTSFCQSSFQSWTASASRLRTTSDTQSIAAEEHTLSAYDST